MTVLNIVPECYIDTKIAEILGEIKRLNHQHGSGDVANILKNRLRDQIALGIIDEDKNKGPVARYFSEFVLLNQENNLILKRHENYMHYLILICPEAEKWLLADAKKTGINPSDYGLSDQLKGLIQISKTSDIDKNEGFKRFIKALLREKGPSVTTLKQWIELFKSCQLGNLNPISK